MPRQLFVNLCVRDLARSRAFWEGLGFTFEPRFTSDQAACMIVSPDAFVMLLEEPFFRTFTHRDLADPHRQTEGLFALSCRSRAEVDELVRSAFAIGGAYAMDPVDHGSMYGWSFYDPDGHHWEVVWVDPEAAEGRPPPAGVPGAWARGVAGPDAERSRRAVRAVLRRMPRGESSATSSTPVSRCRRTKRTMTFRIIPALFAPPT